MDDAAAGPAERRPRPDPARTPRWPPSSGTPADGARCTSAPPTRAPAGGSSSPPSATSGSTAGRGPTARSASPTSSPPRACTAGSTPTAWAAMKTASGRRPPARRRRRRPRRRPRPARAPGRRVLRAGRARHRRRRPPADLAALRRRPGRLRRSTSPRRCTTGRPDLFPLLVRTTRWQLLPHVREGDSGVEAVIHRELARERRGVRRAAARRAGRPRAHRAPAARRPAVAQRQPAADARRRARRTTVVRPAVTDARIGAFPPRDTARTSARAAMPQGRRRRHREEWWHVRPINHRARQPAVPRRRDRLPPRRGHARRPGDGRLYRHVDDVRPRQRPLHRHDRLGDRGGDAQQRRPRCTTCASASRR